MGPRENGQEEEGGNWKVGGTGIPVTASSMTVQQWPSLLTHETYVIMWQTPRDMRVM